jgi:peptide methionine sulfoxide reductase MsrA
LELCSKGHNQSEIARILQVGVATISRDVHYIQQDLYNKRKEFGEQIFVEYQKSLYGLDQVLKKLWDTVDADNRSSSNNSSSTSFTSTVAESKERAQALSLIMQCYDKRLEIINSSPISYQVKEYKQGI